MRNEDFSKLSEEKYKYALCILYNILSPYWEKDGLIHEVKFDEVFEEDDEVNKIVMEKGGKPLNNMAINHQRLLSNCPATKC